MFLETILIAAVLAAASIAAFQLLHASFPRLRLAPGDGHRIVGRYRNVAANVAAAVLVYLAGVGLLGEYLVDPSRPSRWYAPFIVLLLYDFFYYWLHRTLHRPPLMRLIHVVHHRTRHPTAVDSLYLHPLETAMGLAVLLGCIAMAGPLSVVGFAAVSLLHALINVIDHANLNVPSRLAWLCNHWSARHDLHHSRGGNYGSITPVWDWLFGTTAKVLATRGRAGSSVEG